MDETCAKAVQKLVLADSEILKTLGIKIVGVATEAVVLSMRIRPDMVNSQGICHGGFLFGLSDTAAAYSVAALNGIPVTTEANISYIAPALLDDNVTANAIVQEKTSKMLYIATRVQNQRGETLAIHRCTCINRGTCV
ncbi:MAG: hypothetical protein RL417_1318 [Pseudomonadota bacterium]|jgi:acyl-CoA thioesterase